MGSIQGSDRYHWVHILNLQNKSLATTHTERVASPIGKFGVPSNDIFTKEESVSLNS